MKERPSWLKVWTTAARPHTLTASLAPCLVAYSTSPDATLLFIWGTDRKSMVNKRATAQGWLTPTQTCAAATVAVSVTALAGVALLYVSKQLRNVYLWIAILTSLFNAFAYTGGPYPLGYIGIPKWSIAYSGLGDVFVFLYFGLVATYMVPLLEGKLDIHVFIHGIQVGLLAMNILVVNNLRDRHTDSVTHKRTTAVRFGRQFSVMQYTACSCLAFCLVLVDAILSRSISRLFPLISLRGALLEVGAVRKLDGAVLNPHVAGAAKVQFQFCALLCIGVKLSMWIVPPPPSNT